MIEVPYTELIPGNNYYVTKGPPERGNKHFGTFTRTDHKPNGDAWVYFNDVETLDKTKNRKISAYTFVFILRDTDLYEEDPSLQEWHFYKEIAASKKNDMYEKVLERILRDENAIKEFSPYIHKSSKSKPGSKSKKGGKRTKKQRKSKRI